MLKAVALGLALSLAAGAAFAAARISVHSDAIGPDGRIAARNSAYGTDLSPEVNWTQIPAARSYVIILDDPDAPGSGPFVHWLVWNIPAAQLRLAEGATPPDATEGRNGRGGTGYWGPHPPSGTHHYHLQVFALDTVVALASGADRARLAKAMHGHVIASGEVVGLFSAPPR
jgi:Raf kinase inhibitor-like YbhB/YbcL family protein